MLRWFTAEPTRIVVAAFALVLVVSAAGLGLLVQRDFNIALAERQEILESAKTQLEIRVQLFEALSELLEHQPAYAGIMNDYQTVLRYRSSEESLEDAARPYLAIFEALAGRGLADQTATTWAFLHEGLRHGHLEGGDGALQTLADRFVSLFTQVRNVREACQRLLH